MYKALNLCIILFKLFMILLVDVSFTLRKDANTGYEIYRDTKYRLISYYHTLNIFVRNSQLI